MKRREFLRELRSAGCQLKRHGRRHDIYENAASGHTAPVPRHAEIKNSLCRLISGRGGGIRQGQEETGRKGVLSSRFNGSVVGRGRAEGICLLQSCDRVHYTAVRKAGVAGRHLRAKHTIGTFADTSVEADISVTQETPEVIHSRTCPSSNYATYRYALPSLP